MSYTLLGTDYYKIAVGNNIKKNAICLSFGVAEDILADIQLVYKYNAQVYLFDITEKSINHYNAVINYLNNKPSEYVFPSNYKNELDKYVNKIDTSRLIYNDYGIFSKNKKLTFYKPINKAYASVSYDISSRADIDKNDRIVADVFTMEHILKKINLSNIDYLKLNIENSEVLVLEHLLLHNIYPNQIFVYFSKINNNNNYNSVYNLYTFKTILKRLSIYYNITKINEAGTCHYHLVRIINAYLPSERKGYFNHTNDSFRELLIEWGKRGLVKLNETNSNHCWIENNILLYDRPIMDWYMRSIEFFNFGLFGNTIPKYEALECSPWIFWARHPLNMENLEIIDYNNREYNTIFIGKIENEVQLRYRDTNLWKKHIDFFDLVIGNSNEKYKYTNIEYVNLIRKSRFGLSLRGYGPKCHREVELMACGTIPIVTRDVDLTYYNNIVEGLHYFVIDNPEDITVIINNTSRELWQTMSNACVKWYKENCTIEGSFNTTLNIIQNHYNKLNNIASILIDCSALNNNFNKFISYYERLNSNIPLYLLNFNSNLDLFDNMHIMINFKSGNLNETLISIIEEQDNVLYIDFNYLPLYLNKLNNNSYQKYNNEYIYFFTNTNDLTKLSECNNSLYNFDNLNDYDHLNIINQQFYWKDNLIHFFSLNINKDLHEYLKLQINKLNQPIFLKYISDVKVEEKKQLINLIIQTYPEKNIDRLNELILCIVSNLENGNVSKVINLCEGDDDNYLPSIIRNHSKYFCKKGFDRLTYKKAFEYSNQHLNNEIVGLINTDIMLDDNFNTIELNKILIENTIIANSRYEIDLSTSKIFLDENFKRIFHSNTQDAWFYRTPINVNDCDFELGLVGCDNAIAHRLKSSGYNVFNMVERFKIIHVDSSRGKNSLNFNTFHKENEIKQKINNKHPENTGSLLVPNYDAVSKISIDKLLETYNYNEQEKVLLIAEIINQKIKIKN